MPGWFTPTGSIPEDDDAAMLVPSLLLKQKPVVLFVDDAHDLNRNTLIALKRLIELVEGGRAARNSPSCWPVTRGFAMSYVRPWWRRSAAMPRSIRSRALPAAREWRR